MIRRSVVKARKFALEVGQLKLVLAVLVLSVVIVRHYRLLSYVNSFAFLAVHRLVPTE